MLNESYGGNVLENISLNKKWNALNKADQVVKADKQKDWTSYYNRWEWRAVACLADLKNFNPEPAWIAKRLNLNEETAASSLHSLENLGILVRDENGKLLKSKNIQYGVLDESDIMKSQMLISTEINTRLMDRKKFRHGHYFISTSKEKMGECLKNIQDSIQKLLNDPHMEDANEVFGLNLSCVSFIKGEEEEKTQ